MGQMTNHDQIFLELHLSKALDKDEFGNVIFEAEASNENLDIEQQRVLQSALLQTKDYFLKSGVISKDHKHRTFNEDGTYDIHEEFVIGEPISVSTDGLRTMVKGKLYPKNEHAKKLIDLFEQGSTRIKASVGGLVPRIKKTIENGKKIGEVVSVLWDDLALTITPVNHTVEPAVSMAKSLSSLEFVKALSVGYGTDSAAFTGGRALQKEEAEDEQIPIAVNEGAVIALVGAINDGDVTDEDEAESFLSGYGIQKSDAGDIFRAVCNKSNQFLEVIMADEKKAGLWDGIKEALRKSTASKPKDDDDPADTSADDPTKDDDDDAEYEDATAVVKALSEKIASLEETVGVMAKAQTTMLERMAESEVLQKSIGQGIIAVMDRTDEVLASPAPRKGAVTQLEATMAKALGGGDPAGGAVAGGGLKPFTEKTLNMTKDILIKAVSDGEIDIHTCGKYETQMNKSVGKASFAFSDDFVAFMKKHVS